jgi:solute carrier family 30 (zinc transporter), member 2
MYVKNEGDEYQLLQDKRVKVAEMNKFEQIRKEIKETSPIILENTAKNEETLKKLWIVSGICLIFMGIEVTGGYLANSIAIMSDAAHLLSDFLGFIISIVSIYISRRGATHQMSFGYHRAEVIGALVSVTLIWGLTIWLLYEASQRIVHRNPVDGLIMLITALIGFVFNVVMGVVLAYQGIDHNLHHHHDHEHGEDVHDHGGVGHYHPPKRAMTMDLKKSDEPKKVPRRAETMIGERPTKEEHDHDEHDHDHDEHDHDHDEHDHDHDEHDHDHTDPTHKHSDKDHTNAPKAYKQKKSSGDVSGTKVHEHDHDKDTQIQVQDHSHDHSHEENYGAAGDSHGHSHENVNLRAALIHVIGDAVQNLGVVIAGLIIYFYPEASIADPICTFIFSIIVVFTTIRILKDCISVLMEGSPLEFDMENLEKDLYNIRGVVEVHDLHVWSLSVGKLSLSCHLTSTNPQISLKKARKLIKQKYKITHSTIQVELESEKGFQDCAHDLHQEIYNKRS